MDTGDWFSGRFTRDAKGRLSGLSDFRIAPILDREGQPIGSKWASDAEGTAVRGGDILVSFERDHRIDAYALDKPQLSGPIRTLALPFPVGELRKNRGLETVALSPQDGPLAGATVTVSEMSLNAAGDLYAGILDGPERGTFFVHRDGSYAVSDGDFLPNGDLLLLERTISLVDGFGVRIVRIPGAAMRPGSTVDGKVIFAAGFGAQIDNMDGLSVTRGSDGGTYLTMVSDDNSSILQRSLFLEFRLVGD
ncbi:MAG: esterase-like activity of phytase family protein [Pararhizobium sp.]